MRRLLPADAEGFASLVRDAFAGQSVNPLPSALRVTGADIARHIAGGGSGVVVAEGEILAAGLLWAELAGGLYISRVSVRPEHRRQGIAAALIVEATREGRRCGLPRVWLSTRLAMTANRRLFQGLGFEEGERHTHAGFSEPTSVDMHLDLAANQQAS